MSVNISNTKHNGDSVLAEVNSVYIKPRPHTGMREVGILYDDASAHLSSLVQEYITMKKKPSNFASACLLLLC